MAEANDKLSDIVRIARHYQRSIRIDIDYGRPCIGWLHLPWHRDGCCRRHVSADRRHQSTGVHLDGTLWRWKIVIGGGSRKRSGTQQSVARKLANSRLDDHPMFDKALPCRKGWLVIPIVGKRASVVQELPRHAQGLGPWQ